MVRELQLQTKSNILFRPTKWSLCVLMFLLGTWATDGFASHHRVGDKANYNYATVKPENIAVIGDNAAMLTPPFTCPNDVTLSCTQYSGDPEDYGQPVANYGFSITILSYNVNDATNGCGIGQITRTWSIQTQYGTGTCVQKITIHSGASFGPHLINWPPDYDIDGCLGSVHPQDLPPPYDKPTWTNVPCTMIGTAYQDQIIYVGGSGCKKILRTWKVMDWCQYQTNQYPPVGLWTHVQVIKFKDDEPPVITSCPEDITVSNGSNCSGVYVNLTPVTAIDNCTNNLLITNNFNGGGGNASGYYPLGNTRVVFTVKDDCGNTSTCEVNVRVRDGKKPTAIAYHGLTATLMAHPGGPMVQVNPALFNAGSHDNCTPSGLLTFALEPNLFTCENLGENTVKFIVYDQSGNSDYVITYLIVQDNMDMCPDSLIGNSVAGKITTPINEPLDEIEIAIKGNGYESIAMSNQDGSFEKKSVKKDTNILVAPVFEGSLLHGVDLKDLVIIRRHLLGTDKLDSPYKLLAADIDGSGHVSIQDYIQLRFAMLLGIENFPGLKSWRFIDKKYEFELPENPFEEVPDESCMVNTLQGNVKGVDFIGIKTGDLDNSYYIDMVEGRNANATLNFYIGEMTSQGIPVYIGENSPLLAFNFALEIDIQKLKIEEIVSNSEQDLNLFIMKDPNNEDIWYISWDDITPRDIAASEPLFFLKTSQMGDLSAYSAIKLSSINPAINRALGADWMLKNIHLQLNSNLAGNNDKMAMDLYPNPLRQSQLQILVNSRTISFGSLAVWDMSGRMIHSNPIELVEGNNNLIINTGFLNQPGIYQISIHTSDDSISKRLVVLE